MRWPSPRPRKPAHWDNRIREGFLWIPKRLDGEWRWLERAAWRQFFDDPEGDSGMWRSIAWYDEPLDSGRG